MNRGELRDYVQSLGKRTDATDALVNGFIAQAEAMIADRVRAPEMIADPVTLDETDREAAGRYTLPADFLGMRSVWSSAGWPLTQLSLADLRGYAAGSGVFFYSVYGFNIEFRGVPVTDAEHEIIYFARPAAMTDDLDEPTLLTNHPGLYIHSTMFWYRIWSEDVELASAHGEAFDGQVDTVNAAADDQNGGAKTGPTSNLGNFRAGSTY